MFLTLFFLLFFDSQVKWKWLIEKMFALHLRSRFARFVFVSYKQTFDDVFYLFCI